MDIKFLGTGAADWEEKMHNEKGYRRLSSLLINNDLLIDPGPNIYSFKQDLGSTTLFDSVKDILLTHSHDDHLCFDTLSKLSQSSKRNLWCSDTVGDIFDSVNNIKVEKIPCFSPIKVNDYTVTAVPANHLTEDPHEQALHFIIQKEDKCIFYGCDGAWLREDTWYFIKNYKFDFMILDGTLGNAKGDYRIFEHNNLCMVKAMSQTIRSCKLLKDIGKIYISHLSRFSHGTQLEIESSLKESKISVAYDGLTITI